MDWLLAALAVFNLVSMIAVFMPRLMRRAAVPWTTFAVAALATELAWVWLPLQASIALVLILAGALGSWLGEFAIVLLLVTWPGLAWSILLSLRSEAPVEEALRSGLGRDYLDKIPPERRSQLRGRVRFADWRLPFSMKRPGVEKLSDIAYGPGGIRQMLDIYRPTQIPPEGCPVLMQIHGGAWMIGDKGQQAMPLMYLMASKGWICVSVNYRLSPSTGFPTHLEDCKRALCWIRTKGVEYGMNPDFVAVTGGSAGGHLSALMGLTGNRADLQSDFPGVDTAVQACVPFYGVYDVLTRFGQHPNREVVIRFLHERVIHQSPDENPELWDLASPVMQVHADAPPFMLVHGKLDSLAMVTDAHAFRDRLRAVSRNPVVYLELPGTEHGFDNLHSARTENTINAVHRFLEWSRVRASRGGVEEASE